MAGNSSSNSTTTNNNSIHTTSGAGKPRNVGRPRSINLPACTWCGESKTPLKYVLPTLNGKEEFCSETCISEFRKAGVCVECYNPIRESAPSREFCSTTCMNKNKKNKAVKNGSTTTSRHNNNNSNSNNNNNETTRLSSSTQASSSPSGPFQYESFHVFNWENYLAVRY